MPRATCACLLQTQFVDQHEVKFCMDRLLKPADPDAAAAALKKDEALLLGQEE